MVDGAAIDEKGYMTQLKSIRSSLGIEEGSRVVDHLLSDGGGGEWRLPERASLTYRDYQDVFIDTEMA